MPGQPGGRQGDAQRAQKDLPPIRPPAREVHDQLLGRPPIDVETVGEVAEIPGIVEKPVVPQGEADRQIGPGERKQHDEPPEQHEQGERGEGEQHTPPGQHDPVADEPERHAGAEQAAEPDRFSEVAERLQVVLEKHRDDSDRGHRNRSREAQQPGNAQDQHQDVHHRFVAKRPQGAIDQQPDRIVDEQHPRKLHRPRVEGQPFVEEIAQLRVGQVRRKGPGADERAEQKGADQDIDDQQESKQHGSGADPDKTAKRQARPLAPQRRARHSWEPCPSCASR